MICFSVPQSKYLLKQCFEVNKLTELNGICENQNALKDSTILGNLKVIGLLETQKANLYTIIDHKDEINLKLKSQLDEEKGKTQYQRNLKRAWIGVSGVISGFFLYYVVKH